VNESQESRPRRAYKSARRQQQAVNTRAEVLDAALLLFADRGWAGTGMRDVAREAGVSVETVYANFRSKSDLLMAAIEVGEDFVPSQRQRASVEEIFKFQRAGLAEVQIDQVDLVFADGEVRDDVRVSLGKKRVWIELILEDIIAGASGESVVQRPTSDDVGQPITDQRVVEDRAEQILHARISVPSRITAGSAGNEARDDARSRIEI